jgi:hypothetical protein
MLEPSIAAATGQTMHRRRPSRPHSADGHREPSLGRAADPRRIAETRAGRLRTHCVAVSARPRSCSVADVAYIPCQPPRCTGSHLLGTSNPPGDAVDASDARLCLAPSIRDGSCIIHRWVVVEWQPSFPRPSPGARVAQDLLYRRRGPSNKDPPQGMDRRIGFQGLWAEEEASTGSRHQLS